MVQMIDVETTSVKYTVAFLRSTQKTLVIHVGSVLEPLENDIHDAQNDCQDREVYAGDLRDLRSHDKGEQDQQRDRRAAFFSYRRFCLIWSYNAPRASLDFWEEEARGSKAMLLCEPRDGGCCLSDTYRYCAAQERSDAGRILGDTWPELALKST